MRTAGAIVAFAAGLAIADAPTSAANEAPSASVATR